MKKKNFFINIIDHLFLFKLQGFIYVVLYFFIWLFLCIYLLEKYGFSDSFIKKSIKIGVHPFVSLILVTFIVVFAWLIIDYGVLSRFLGITEATPFEKIVFKTGVVLSLYSLSVALSLMGFCFFDINECGSKKDAVNFGILKIVKVAEFRHTDFITALGGLGLGLTFIQYIQQALQQRNEKEMQRKQYQAGINAIKDHINQTYGEGMKVFNEKLEQTISEHNLSIQKQFDHLFDHIYKTRRRRNRNMKKKKHRRV